MPEKNKGGIGAYKLLDSLAEERHDMGDAAGAAVLAQSAVDVFHKMQDGYQQRAAERAAKLTENKPA